MRDDDLIRLRHMLDATNETLAFAQDNSRDDLDKDRMLALAQSRCIPDISGQSSKG